MAKRTAFFSPLSKVLFFLLLLLGGGLIWQNANRESRFDPQIRRAALKYDISPALVKAVIWQESHFNPKARGAVGEVGLMQIRKLTAQEWCTDNKIKSFDPSHLLNPQTNIYIGSWYLSKMLKRYNKTDNPLPYALSDYNAGRKIVLKWSEGPAQTNSSLFLENITYPSTRRYVESVIRRSQHYQREFR
ncbi:MAG TPA: lytic transglycosylase domain-containing protein [Verrucomicrobiota bacterium]|jgi:soluble lytic murein transglycosylase|nr:lytic transglycosylase domain-containing protein [Verrucomicrobiota bacterium]